MDYKRAVLVERVAKLLCDWDGYDTDEVQTMSDGTTYVMWQSYSNKATAAIDLIRAETLEEAALVKVTPPTFTGTTEEQAFFLKGWMEAMSAKRFAIRSLKGDNNGR